ncbi:MAG: hypothetical protein PHG87_02670 [Candidatus Omnitrophica bacterium]|nr:hypothetical protein [Candidatus Omnitrophota bacterium]
MRKIVIIILALILLPAVVSLAGPLSVNLDSGFNNSPPAPRLRYPINDTVILSLNQALEFSWWNDFTQTRGYIFKLYKGYNMFAANLIFKEELPSEASLIKIKPELFNAGQVYTWSLVRISFSGSKSDKSFNSFKVIIK